jgi:hypothetical protein
VSGELNQLIAHAMSAALRYWPQSAAPLEGIGPSGTRLHSLSFPILRFAADCDLFELANDFGSLS